MSEGQVPTVPARRTGWGHVVVAVAVLLAAASLVVAFTRNPASAASTAPGCGGSNPHLTVQGTGQASGSPDELNFDAQVSVNAASAQSALAQDSATSGMQETSVRPIRAACSRTSASISAGLNGFIDF